MAALPELPAARIVALHHVSAQDLTELLEQEHSEWRKILDWDISDASELVDRFVRMQSLNGFALLRGARVIGYLYFVREEHKALIGDMYVMPGERTQENSYALLEAAVDALRAAPGVHRIESQFLLEYLSAGRSVARPFSNRLTIYPRKFMMAHLKGPSALAPRVREQVRIEPWRPHHHEASAWLIASGYKGHVDADINDQYRSPAGARRFLANIVQYPGCGSFFAPGSFAASEEAGGALCGVSLASLVASDSGHVTQLCVSQAYRGQGLGYELLRRSMDALAAQGCRTASLTVTSSNREAIDLYRSMGFAEHHEFPACIWEL